MFTLLKNGLTKIDGMLKISTKWQELANDRYEILSDLKEQREGNCRAEIALMSRGDTVIELHFPIKMSHWLRRGCKRCTRVWALAATAGPGSPSPASDEPRGPCHCAASCAFLWRSRVWSKPLRFREKDTNFSTKWDGMNQNSKSNKPQEINKADVHTRGWGHVNPRWRLCTEALSFWKAAQLAGNVHADRCPHSWDNYKEAISDLQVQVPSHSPVILRGPAGEGRAVCALSVDSLIIIKPTEAASGADYYAAEC